MTTDLAAAPTRASESALSDEQLLALLWTEADRLPRSVIDEIVRRGERLVPRLGEIVQDPGSWEDLDPPGFWAAIHAAFALSATGRQDAVDLLLDALRHADVEDVDWITDCAGELFNRVGPACFTTLRAVVRDVDEAPYVRWHCLDAMAALSLQQPDLQREVIRDAARFVDDEVLQDAAQVVLANYAAFGRRPEVLEALGVRGRTPRWLEDIGGPEPFFFARRDPLAFYDPKAVAARQERWRKEAEADARAAVARERQASPEVVDQPRRPAPQPATIVPVRAEPRISRNDPCPCGSGRKHKKCCLR